jgi:hypothetical protein
MSSYKAQSRDDSEFDKPNLQQILITNVGLIIAENST